MSRLALYLLGPPRQGSCGRARDLLRGLPGEPRCNHCAYPDGTAIRFESFQLWDLNRYER
jgi:hypothetical protein